MHDNITAVQPNEANVHIIEPYQYYVRNKESITITDGKYLHRDHKGREIFKSDGYENNKVDVIESSKLFEELFLELMNGNNENALFEEHLEKIKSSSLKDPVFIVGCGRSGTTLLLSIMDAHPNIVSIKGESFAFYPKPFRPGIIAYHLDELNICKNKRWCEKTPKHIHSVKEINSFFEGRCKFIYMVRDGRDVVTSVHPSNPNSFWVPLSRWIDDNQKGLSYGNDVYRVKYEDLIINPEETLGGICNYIDEPFYEELLSFSDRTSVKEDLAWFGKVRALHSERIGKWKNNEYKEKIKEFLLNTDACRIMNELGYSM